MDRSVLDGDERPRTGYPGRRQETDRAFGTTGLPPCTRQRTAKKANEGAGTRTQDQRIKSPLLYRLSYALDLLP